MSKGRRVRKINKKLKKQFTVVEEVAFDCTKNGDDP